MGTERDAIVEAVWVRRIGPSFGFEERRMKIAPIDANITVVVRRLKAQAVYAKSTTRVRRRLSARNGAPKNKDGEKLWQRSHLLIGLQSYDLGLEGRIALDCRPLVFGKCTY